MLSTSKYDKARELIEQIERQNAEANGALKQSMKTLRKFDCKTIEDGIKLKNKLKRKLAKHDKAFDKLFSKLQKKANKKIKGAKKQSK